MPGRLTDVTLDDASIREASPEVEIEKRTAIHDLLLDNAFTPVVDGEERDGAYTLHIGLGAGQLVLDITDGTNAAVRHSLSLTPLKRVMRDYFLIHESYTRAAAEMSPAQLEAIDMGRRGAHDEGAEIVQARLKGKIAIDHATARRLFTLVCALHWRGDMR